MESGELFFYPRCGFKLLAGDFRVHVNCAPEFGYFREKFPNLFFDILVINHGRSFHFSLTGQILEIRGFSQAVVFQTLEKTATLFPSLGKKSWRQPWVCSRG